MDGLVGFALRKELLGHQAWTMSVWRDASAMSAWAASAMHREAVERTRDAIVELTTQRVVIPSAALPVSWDDARTYLDEPSRSDH